MLIKAYHILPVTPRFSVPSASEELMELETQGQASRFTDVPPSESSEARISKSALSVGLGPAFSTMHGGPLQQLGPSVVVRRCLHTNDAQWC